MKTIFWLAASMLALATGAKAETRPSVYLATGPHHLLIIEIYEQPDGHVVGEVETLKMSLPGLVQVLDYGVVGTVNNGQVSLKPKIDGIGDAYNGAIDGQGLHVASEGQSVTLAKSDLASLDKARADLETTVGKAGAAWDETQPMLDAGKLSKTGDLLPPLLTSLRSSSDMLIDGFQTIQGMQSQYISALKQKLATAAPGDRAKIEDSIQTTESGMYAAESDLIEGGGISTQSYVFANSMLTFFEVACANAAKANVQTPAQCGKAADYTATFQTSQADTRAKFAVAEQMFEPRP